MRIYVTRHGETDWNAKSKVMGKANIRLNEKGINQAKETREKLAGTKIDLIIVSPLVRALETAKIINEVLNTKVIIDERISERDFGEFEGSAYKEVNSIGFWDYYENHKYQKAENIEAFFTRVYDFLDSLAELDSDLNILIVAHGGISIPINCYFNGLPDDNILFPLVLDNCEVASYYLKNKKMC